jgi:hypothetical protein
LKIIQVTPTAPTVLIGSTQQLTATATYSDNSTKTSPSGVAWSSSNTNLATVDTNGVVTPVALGAVTITATLNAVSGSAAATVVTVLQTLDRSSSVAGPDADGNGVRDDIDQVIASYKLTGVQTKAVVQYAAAIQAAMLTTTDANSGYSNAVEVQRGEACMASQVGTGYEKYVKQIHAFTFNTQQRVMAYITFEQNIGGSVFPQVTGTICK